MSKIITYSDKKACAGRTPMYGAAHEHLRQHHLRGVWLAPPTASVAGELAGARAWLRAQHGVDLFDGGLPPLGWWRSSTRLNLVLAAAECFCPPSDAQRDACAGLAFTCVGSLLEVGAGALARARPPVGALPLDAVRHRHSNTHLACAPRAAP